MSNGKMGKILLPHRIARSLPRTLTYQSWCGCDPCPTSRLPSLQDTSWLTLRYAEGRVWNGHEDVCVWQTRTQNIHFSFGRTRWTECWLVISIHKIWQRMYGAMFSQYSHKEFYKKCLPSSITLRGKNYEFTATYRKLWRLKKCQKFPLKLYLHLLKCFYLLNFLSLAVKGVLQWMGMEGGWVWNGCRIAMETGGTANQWRDTCSSRKLFKLPLKAIWLYKWTA